MNHSILLVLLITYCFQIAHAQDNKIYTTQSTTSSIELDGQFSEPAWRIVDWAGDFTQVDPEIGAAPTFQTQFKILFDEAYLYVAIQASDSQPSEIVHLTTARDFFDGDYGEINIDSDADQKDAFSFTATAAGIRGDEHIITSDNWRNDWNPYWEVKTALQDTGWSAEMKIPLRELELYTGAQSWGIQVNRYIERIDELSSWNPVPDEDRWTEYFGTLRGVETLKMQSPAGVTDRLETNAMIQDIRVLMQSLQSSYPSVYRYRSPDLLKALYDQTVGTFAEGLTHQAFYVALASFVSKIGDGHMQVTFPERMQEALRQQQQYLPFVLQITENDVFITTNYLGTAEPWQSARLLAINGRPINEVITELIKMIPSDGYNRTGKHHKLAENFDFYHQLVYGTAPTTTIDYLPFNEQAPTSATFDLWDHETLQQLQAKLPPKAAWKPFEFEVIDSVGILTIRTFNGRENFTNFIDESFQKIADLQLESLIIDVRDNGGGDEINAIHLYSYLTNAPFKYYDRYEVRTPAQSLKRQQGTQIAYETMNFLRSASSLDNMGQQIIEDITALDGRLIDPKEWQQPASSNRFIGQVVVLINGGSFSATSEVCAIMARDKRVTFVGTETGGGMDGNTSGLYERITLPHSGLQVRVPLIKYVSAVGELGYRFGRGVMPDVTVYPTYDSNGEVIDRALAVGMELLKGR